MTSGQREASKPIRASDAVAALVKQLRLRRGVTVKDLAGKCRDLGAEHLTANVLTNIELLVLALALDVAPAFLLTPGDASTSIAVTASEAHPADAVEQWILGTAPLLSSGSTPYVQYAIERAAGRGQQTDHASALLRARTSGLVEQYEAEAQLFLGKVRNQVVDLVDFLHESVTNGVPAEELALVLESVKNRVSPPPSVAEAQTATGPEPTSGS
jgi:hypothetical protein